jgi:hypothetical protein
LKIGFSVAFHQHDRPALKELADLNRMSDPQAQKCRDQLAP